MVAPRRRRYVPYERRLSRIEEFIEQAQLNLRVLTPTEINARYERENPVPVALIAPLIRNPVNEGIEVAPGEETVIVRDASIEEEILPDDDLSVEANPPDIEDLESYIDNSYDFTDLVEYVNGDEIGSIDDQFEDIIDFDEEVSLDDLFKDEQADDTR